MKRLLQEALQLVNIFFRRGPRRDETADGMLDVGLAPVAELYVARQPLHGVIVQDDELLVGGRVKVELVAFFLEYLFHPHGHLDGMARQVEVEVVCEQGFELQTDEGTLGDDGSVLLLDAEEVFVGW